MNWKTRPGPWPGSRATRPTSPPPRTGNRSPPASSPAPYHELWRIEKSFRMSKSDLQAKPIYHRKRDSIEAHLSIVFAALAVTRWIEANRLVNQEIRQDSPPLPHHRDPGRTADHHRRRSRPRRPTPSPRRHQPPPLTCALGWPNSGRRSSACAAARPGAPADHRTRPSGLRRRSRPPSAAVGGAGPTARRRPPVSGAQRTSRAFHNRQWAADVSVRAAVAGTCMPRLRNRSFCCSMFWSASARVGDSAPRPHATSPNPAALAHTARARCRRPAAECLAPTAAWVTASRTQ